MPKLIGIDYEEYPRWNEKCINIHYENEVTMTIWHDCRFDRLEGVQTLKRSQLNGVLVWIDHK